MIVVGYIVGIIGLGAALWFYYHLWRWAREMQYARIAIAYKGKVKVDATLTEWLLWTRQADKDKYSNGRVVFQVQGVRVAILKMAHQKFGPRQFVREVTSWITKPVNNTVKTLKGSEKLKSPVKVGKWTSSDETPEENKLPVRDITA